MSVDPGDEAFARACLWILERLGGDSRFLSVHPASESRGAGISFEVDESSRIELARVPGSDTVFLGIGTTDRELHERNWWDAGGTEESVALHLSDCYERAGLCEPAVIVRESNGEHWIATRLRGAAADLASIEGRDRMLRRIEGFHLAFSARDSRP